MPDTIPSFPAAVDTATAFATVWQRLSTDLSRGLQQIIATPADADALHDLRVALRKSRALLTLCPAKLAGRRRFERAFHRLGLATGPLRELDVLLKKIRDTSIFDRDTPTSLDIMLMAQRSDAQAQLLRAVDAQRIEPLLQEWRIWLNDFPQQEALRARWRIPAAVSIDVLVRDQCIALLRRGSRIDKDSSAAAVHKLRIRAKRLRYLLESFLPLFDRDHYEPLVQALHKLQQLLGRHQDAVVMKHQLKDAAAELARNGLLTPESTALIEHWLHRSREKRRKTRKDLPGALADFAVAANRI